jgi:hypothetical protein
MNCCSDSHVLITSRSCEVRGSGSPVGSLHCFGRRSVRIRGTPVSSGRAVTSAPARVRQAAYAASARYWAIAVAVSFIEVRGICPAGIRRRGRGSTSTGGWLLTGRGARPWSASESASRTSFSVATRMRWPVSSARRLTVGERPSQVPCATPYARSSPVIRETSCRPAVTLSWTWRFA